MDRILKKERVGQAPFFFGGVIIGERERKEEEVGYRGYSRETENFADVNMYDAGLLKCVCGLLNIYISGASFKYPVIPGVYECSNAMCWFRKK